MITQDEKVVLIYPDGDMNVSINLNGSTSNT